MFCSNCGKKINTEERFCHHCGNQNKNHADTVTPAATVHSEVQSDPETNKNVMRNYLYNLRALEFAKNKLTEEKQNTEGMIQLLGTPDYIPKKKKIWDCGTNFVFAVFAAIIFLACHILRKAFASGEILSVLEPLLGTPVIVVMVISALLFAVLIIHAFGSVISDAGRYRREVHADRIRVANEEIEKQKYVELLPVVTKELSSTEHLLNKAYSVNIIPSKYRHLGGIHFIYDYMSTSNVSLNDALFHCDMDEISKKLDTIIEQNREMIMEMAYSRAMNRQMIAQNEEMLKHAIATERNTALAAQYSQVAAVNSATTAQIQTYHFFKNSY